VHGAFDDIGILRLGHVCNDRLDVVRIDCGLRRPDVHNGRDALLGYDGQLGQLFVLEQLGGFGRSVCVFRPR